MGKFTVPVCLRGFPQLSRAQLQRCSGHKMRDTGASYVNVAREHLHSELKATAMAKAKR